jgi:hypothetical protein
MYTNVHFIQKSNNRDLVFLPSDLKEYLTEP